MGDQSRRLLVFAPGNQAIGTSIADLLAQAGNEVVLASSAAPAADSKYRKTLLFDMEAADAEMEVERLLRETGPIDAVVLAEGTSGTTARLDELSSDEWARVVRQNATLGFLLCRQAIPVLSAAKDGRIVFLLPEDVRGTPQDDAMPFVVAKAASVGLMRTLALEIGGNGITANAIACPRSPSTARGDAPETSEVFATLSFLLSPASGFVTGQVVDVNRGRSML